MKEIAGLTALLCVLCFSGTFVALSTLEYSPASDETTMAAAPVGLFCDHVVHVGDNFTMNFTVANVPEPGIYSWEIHVYFDPAILTIADKKDVYLPSDHVFAGKRVFEVDPMIVPPGYLVYGVSLTGDQETFKGSGRLCQVKFRAVANGVSNITIDREQSLLYNVDHDLRFNYTKIDTFIDVGGQLPWIYRDWGKGGTCGLVSTEPLYQTYDFNYSKSAYSIEFTAKLDGANYCNITIPHLRNNKTVTVWDGPFEILLDGNVVNHTVSFNATHTFLDFSCHNASGVHKIRVTEGLMTYNNEAVPMGDLNNDGVVDIQDIFVVASHFGEKSQNP